ncbi:phage major capsid protein E [Gottschalkia purinilytica]|uniref:Phage major capsid protein E n=1 Tax=Gottschalkia purinilytica TaxID=1503 RepID=A0A0L0WAK1_GOTPU|nr:major capsid protein [Gottschalkia purinilytica]KNF08549.1 phage major capsid protein E [Gottschalkia purinilytica]
MNIYNTRTMLEAIEQSKRPFSFLKDTFFPNIETSVSEQIDVDFKKGKREMAPYVSPRVGGKVLKRQGFVTKTYKVPKVAPERLLTVDDVTKRGLGENIYSPKSPDERAVELLAKDIDELDDSIVRREEWSCREVMFNGKLIMKGEGIEQEVDYNFTNNITLTGTDKWNDPASDPIQDLKSARRQIIQKTGVAPNIVVLSSDASDAFLANEKVQEYFDKRNIMIGTMEPSIKDGAVTFIGYINMLGMELYSYDEWFEDDEGNEQPIIPSGKVLVATRGVNRMAYGAVTQIEQGQHVTYEATRVPKVWDDENNDIKNIRVSSRPLPIPADVDGWAVLNVL